MKRAIALLLLVLLILGGCGKQQSSDFFAMDTVMSSTRICCLMVLGGRTPDVLAAIKLLRLSCVKDAGIIAQFPSREQAAGVISKKSIRNPKKVSLCASGRAIPKKVIGKIKKS